MTLEEIIRIPSEFTLAFDASALINIAASGSCTEFFASLGCRCIAETIAWREVANNTEKYKLNRNIEKAVACYQIEIVDMEGEEFPLFLDLVAAPSPNALDDGEAATIAVAHERNLIAVIDEKKGRRVAASLIPPLHVLSTIDLFLIISKRCQPNGMCIGSAIYNALRNARMRVPSEHENWVMCQLTKEQILQCHSLRRRIRESIV